MPRPTAPARPSEPPPAHAHRSALGRIRLRHLQCFLAVAQFGNLRRAAQALSITQPAVTKTLNELESLLGKPLFVRGRQGAALTPEGEAFMRHANDSVNSLGHAVDSVLREPDAAPLRIGVLPTVAPSFLPGVLKAFALHWPGLSVRVGTGHHAQLVEQLRNRELDAVIGRLSDPERMAGLSFEHLYAEPLIVVLRPGHALAPARPAARRSGTAKSVKIKAPPLAALGDWPLVLPLTGTLIRQVADDFMNRHGIQARSGRVETLDTALARALVLRGDNLWFTPLGAALPDLESGVLARLDLAITPEEPVGLILRTEPVTSTTVQTFVSAVRTLAAAWRPPAAGRRR